jgi:uncharacterized protein (DUF2141 family)
MRFLFALSLCALSVSQPSTVHVTVRLVGVQPQRGGVMHVGVHSTPGRGFPGPSPTMNQDIPVGGTDLQVAFNVAPGVYAVAVHHDANANGKVETNFLGIPKEGYAISNDPRPRFRAPTFEESRVTISRDTTLTVRMKY